MKRILCLILGILAVCSFSASADSWRLHPTYGYFLKRIIDTPKYTYLLCGNQPYISFAADYASVTNSLFKYDKGEKETEWLNISTKLSAPVIVASEYNFEKGYLMVCYDNGDIDLLYDNGNVVNVPGLKVADASYSKIINSVTMVPGSDEVYLSTDFGYLTVNDKKGEVGTSRILDRAVTAAVKFDNQIFFGTADGLYYGTERASDFEKVPEVSDVHRLWISGDRLYVWYGSGWDQKVDFLMKGHIARGPINLVGTFIMGIEPHKDGFLIDGDNGIWICDSKGEMQSYHKPNSLLGHAVNGLDLNRLFIDDRLAGVKGGIINKNSGEWTLNGEVILPNAANSYKSPNMAYSDTYGMLVRNHGIDYNFTSIVSNPPDLISGLKNGIWTPYSVYSRAKDKFDVFKMYNPTGLAIDPMDKDMVYCGSILNGILRLNLADPAKSLRLGLKTDAAAGKNGFIGVTDPPSTSSISDYTPFSAPAFDASGYMWVAFNNLNEKLMELWYWSPEDRKATTSASNYRPMKKLDLKGMRGANTINVLPLKYSSNRNIIAISGGVKSFALIDHKGTIDNTADDKIYLFSENISDRDGNKVELGYYKALYEDPSTGNLWVGTDEGVFYFNPRQVIDSNEVKVTRVKVARDDGTSLADYLLDGANINMITADGQGRKWFATKGGGITCTSASGAEVLKVYTSDDTLLPSDYVYGLAYNPANNSMMISTDSGLAELFLSGTSADAEGEDAVVYPNPVRPDYYGYVTIEGLEDGALVKITDSGGNLIKELGFADGGTIQWDVTNLNNKRVRSGVYYVLASGGLDSSGGFSAAAKILVVN